MEYAENEQSEHNSMNVLTEEELKNFSAPIGTRVTYEEYNAEIHTKN